MFGHLFLLNFRHTIVHCAFLIKHTIIQITIYLAPLDALSMYLADTNTRKIQAKIRFEKCKIIAIDTVLVAITKNIFTTFIKRITNARLFDFFSLKSLIKANAKVDSNITTFVVIIKMFVSPPEIEAINKTNY